MGNGHVVSQQFPSRYQEKKQEDNPMSNSVKSACSAGPSSAAFPLSGERAAERAIDSEAELFRSALRDEPDEHRDAGDPQDRETAADGKPAADDKSGTNAFNSAPSGTGAPVAPSPDTDTCPLPGGQPVMSDSVNFAGLPHDAFPLSGEPDAGRLIEGEAEQFRTAFRNGIDGQTNAAGPQDRETAAAGTPGADAFNPAPSGTGAAGTPGANAFNPAPSGTGAGGTPGTNAFNPAPSDMKEDSKKGNGVPTATNPPLFSGDALLNSMGANYAPREAGAPVAPSPDTDTRPLAAELVERILVARDEQARGSGEVRIQLKNSLLPDTEIVLRREEGKLVVVLNTGSPASEQVLRGEIHNLRNKLQELEPDAQVEARLRENGGERDEPGQSSRRSRGLDYMRDQARA
jgi:type III secretion system needle length determinant